MTDSNAISPYILVINGPNLNRLGKRDPAYYGRDTLEEICIRLEQGNKSGYALRFYQSNHEGYLIDEIQRGADDESCHGILINPGAYGHTSLALADALADFTETGKKYGEVHLSDLKSREPIRQTTLTGAKAAVMITGLGSRGYEVALSALVNQIDKPVHDK